MAKSKANAKIYGDLASAVYFGPTGTTLPTTLAAPAAAFLDVGWLANDGVDFARDTNVIEVEAYQAGQIIRRKTLLKLETLKFVCLEENLAVLGLVYPGATNVTATGVTKLTPSGTASVRGMGVIDVFDGTVQKRFNIIDGEYALTGDVPHKSTDATQYEITLSIYDHHILTNNPAWVGP